MIIGSFRNRGLGYVGRIHTLSLDAELSIEPAERTEVEGAPDWRIFLGRAKDGIEIGVGRTDFGSLGLVIAIEIDDPALGAPLRANLDCDSFRRGPLWLRWSRPDAAGQR
jgi:uncharacterized protein (DUF736 family)